MSKRRTELRRMGRTITPLSPTEPWVPLVPVDPTTDIQGDWPTPSNIEAWINNLYIVVVRKDEHGGMHISIHRHDNDWIRPDWRHLQNIKNQIAGPEAEGLELFPAESRLVDTSTQTNLWIMPPGITIPVGWPTRLVNETQTYRSRQRPFEVKPDDLKSAEEMAALMAAYRKEEVG